MENQNNTNKNEARHEGKGSGGRRSHGHHRGGRGRGGRGGNGQEIRTKAGNFIGDTPAAEQAPKASPQPQGKSQEQGGNQNHQGGNPGGGRRRGNRRGRGGDRERKGAVQETARQNEAVRVESAASTRSGGREASPRLNTSPVLSRSVEDKWLDDAFSPLHEAEVVDPAAEETARRILEAEGPLLFREETAEEADLEDIPEGETVEIVGVRFKTPGKVYFFAPGKLKLGRGSYAIVETARGEEYGEVCRGNTLISASEVVQPLRPVLRAATEADALHNEQNKQKEAEAFRICQQKIVEHGLEMKLVEAQYTFDNSKLLFYFTSDGRVDFRELVKDLAGLFRTRIELRQIGIRDEAKLLGGLGTCGRPLCCSGFLPDFVQVSIKMAKEQNLSLNSTKISGCCGRLMCCLRYEFDTYEQEIRMTPSVGSTVDTPDGRGDVVANHPLKGTVTVRLADLPDEAPRVYHRDTVQLCRRERPERRQDEPAEDAAEDASDS